MHEVGHTLGLRHNFKSSAMVSFDKLNDKEYAETHGLCGSVMDYNLVNIATSDEEQDIITPLYLVPGIIWQLSMDIRRFLVAHRKRNMSN